MRNKLPKSIWTYESGIINLDDYEGAGTHWTAYYKNKDIIQYFDSFGNLKPPKEVIHYFNTINKIIYNHNCEQDYNQENCGYLCLKFLYNAI